eukprot:TRINITY_DN21782_c0_g1_i1.p1 TRINITY_DN21782_c0_g1~~TRINITY_DN21782_c0_g1_i1.p1  ORF type:complete len:205 (-),score=33.67 TRINITY_DN21782_c0_g1_i1:117-731(-)
MLRGVATVALSTIALIGLGYASHRLQLRADDEETETINLEKLPVVQRFYPPWTTPEGFAWHQPRIFESGILAPEGWQLRESQKDMTVYAIKERFGDDLYSGLTVSIERNKTTREVQKMLKKREKELRETWETTQLKDQFVSHVMEYEYGSGKSQNMFVRAVVMHNKGTGTIYYLYYEDKRENWVKSWEDFGHAMLSNIHLNTLI